ncbi:hypothetical protein [Roseibium sp. SCP14]|uniref:hypothetical protein n=1 Tax=Roseibium sp. SCP14 TaxID=3141375 RepID=UPI0033362DF4
MNTFSDDRAAIAQLIDQQFGSLCWDQNADGDWATFLAGFQSDARLFASARPAKSQSAHDFVSRMKALRENGTLSEFREYGVGMEIRIVGNIAVALAGCEMHENNIAVTKDVSAFLLVKEPDGWRIAAQAWEVVNDIKRAFFDTGLAVEA